MNENDPSRCHIGYHLAKGQFCSVKVGSEVFVYLRILNIFPRHKGLTVVCNPFLGMSSIFEEKLGIFMK